MPPHPQPLLEPESLGERGSATIELGDRSIDRGHQPLVATGPHGSRTKHKAVVADARIGDMQDAAVERRRLVGKRRQLAATAEHIEADPRQHALLTDAAIGPAVITDPKMLKEHRLLQHAGDLLRPSHEAVEHDGGPWRTESGIEPRV